MEKRKPQYDLKKLKDFFGNDATRLITRTARAGAATMGYMDDDSIAEVINKLCAQHFYKSMTLHHDNKIWQDVYKVRDEEKNLYIKLQLSVDKKRTVLIQMKKDEGGECHA